MCKNRRDGEKEERRRREGEKSFLGGSPMKRISPALLLLPRSPVLTLLGSVYEST
jgi:hypothetical protein